MKSLPSAALLSLILLGSASLAFSASPANPAFDERPVPQKAPAPNYPAKLKAAQIEGTVLLKISIDENGNVTKAEVLKSTDTRFEKSATDTVAQLWKFQPAKKDGQPVSCVVNMPLRFALAD